MYYVGIIYDVSTLYNLHVEPNFKNTFKKKIVESVKTEKTLSIGF